MLDQLRCLIEYQKLEDKKSKLVKGCEETPRRVAELDKEFEKLNGSYLTKKAEYENAKKMHRNLEREIAELEGKITRSKQRMGEVKTNKEYQAMLKEIEDVKKEISTCEDSALQIMDSIESLGREIQDLDKVVAREKSRFDEEKAALTRESDQLRARLDRIEAIQAQVREKIDPNLVKHSDYLIKRRSGIAVAAVEAGVCQVCHLNIPPQKFIELQRDESIHQCPHCSRYIYWPGHEGYCVLDVDVDDL